MSDPTQSPSRTYPMRIVTRRTGLTPDLLRAWERRYGVVTPGRSEGGQRVYTDADIERLRLLHQATQGGHTISAVARLSATDLEQLVREAAAATEASRDASDSSNGTAARVLTTALAATARLDGAALDDTLRRSAISLGNAAFVDRVVAPLMTEVGERWHRGALTAAHEHLATAIVRRVLTWVIETSTTREDAPRIVVGTPAGERHELGALLVHAAAADEGWDVVYLGADLPAEAISRVAREREAAMIALSAVYLAPEALRQEVARLVATLPDDCAVILGGAAADAAEDAVGTMRDVRILSDLSAFREMLRLERNAVAPRAGASASRGR